LSCGILVALVVAAPAEAQVAVLDTYRELDQRRLSPAPLVFTTRPRGARPLGNSVSRAPSGTRRGYGITISAGSRGRVILLERDAYRSLRGFRRDTRRTGLRLRRTRIRGRRGYLATSRGRPVIRYLVWVEDRRVYSLGSSSGVSVRALRSTASGLDRLVGAYAGVTSNPDIESEAEAIVTERTITTRVTWEGQCTFPGSTEPTARVGTALVNLLRRRGSTFSFDIAGHRREGEEFPWTGTVRGTVVRTGVSLSVQATGTSEGNTCSSGTQTYALNRAPRR
jgi:hypothetical protein